MACLGSFVALTVYTATTAIDHLWVLVGFLLSALVIEGAVQLRGRKVHHAGSSIPDRSG
ncbi:hypothetical protein ORI20_24935 [Mycobacterium sp. CVI_P3]|uniref:Uncharacterized protein n=1 Tax=Mycobacterium pinniadriaticum TaxID=2994102 RepID=A0ABT3SKC5_9MYCO|nr:hypothetical protein [Mycobacterium pinniadriaticum]MCX2933523.1 hypothetical protein [Mycobacterium pinniadriaticum]MCX2939976.1 hypothetical protein [Mycobacterium pinniadriaticum]